MTKKEFLNILEWSFVIFVAFYMSIYGEAKALQFGDINEYTRPLFSYDGMSLMWAFYSYSKTYAVILGIFEILGSILFLVPRTRIIGGFVLSAILINVILQDYFYGVHRGAMANAIIYQIIVLIVLFMNKEKLINMIKLSKLDFNFSNKKIILKILLIIVILFALMIAQEGLGMLLNFLKI
ncbi:hypothetical protein VUJ46_22635 [Chryseobacterium sp. MYb264]|uniref:hypothetical protein n=1 Tax=Chryseobacterium sp. MYb264 TaxID=2745153 RepID=UPI002E113D6D|nr:hypothetical protein VUJ46_22635 [Chryseobacterium sp. MYb264]